MPRPDVVLPEPIDDHPGQQVAGPLLGVGDPIGQRRAAIRGPPAGRRRRLPVLLAVGGRVEHLQEAGGGLADLLVQVAALEVSTSSSKKSAPCVWKRIAGSPSLVTMHLGQLAASGRSRRAPRAAC